MLPAHLTRRLPNKGRYLFHNRALHAVLGAVDGVLDRWRPASQDVIDIRPRRILVCNQAHIGDAIWATAALPVLKAAFPSAKIGFLAHPTALGALADNPRLSWVHRVSHWKLDRSARPLWKKLVDDVRSRVRALREIRENRYDLAIDLYTHFPNSVALLRFSGIPVRLGWTSAGAGALLTHAAEWRYDMRHVVESHKRLLARIHACRPHLHLARPELHAAEGVQAQWADIATNEGVPQRYLAFHVGTGGVHRRWPDEHWLMLARLALDAGHALVLLGHGADETALCRRIAVAAPGALDLSGRLTWPQMSEAIAGAQLLVGLESASSHVAAARDVPVVAIYSGINHASLFGPYHRKARVLVHPTPCSPCHLSAGCAGMECVRLTSPQRVFAAIAETLKAGA